MDLEGMQRLARYCLAVWQRPRRGSWAALHISVSLAEICGLELPNASSGQANLSKDLHMLHADPEFQGRGAGSKLIEWGTKKSDELGLPTFLEASTQGHGLYKKHGFKDVEILKVDFTPFGGQLHEQPLMIREPLGIS